MPPQEKRRGTGFPGRRIEPAPHLQTQRTYFAQNRGQRTRMQGFFHDTENFRILRAMDPDNAGRIEAEAGKAWRIAIGKARGPEEKSILLAQNLGCGYCRESRRSHRRFALA
jgi:hypothetical protein